MKAAATFKKALEVLEKFEFRNEIDLGDTSYYQEGLTGWLGTRLKRKGIEVAYIRMVESAVDGRTFWLDYIARLGDGSSLYLDMHVAVAEDLVALAKVWKNA